MEESCILMSARLWARILKVDVKHLPKSTVYEAINIREKLTLLHNWQSQKYASMSIAISLMPRILLLVISLQLPRFYPKPWVLIFALFKSSLNLNLTWHWSKTCFAGYEKHALSSSEIHIGVVNCCKKPIIIKYVYKINAIYHMASNVSASLISPGYITYTVTC